MKNKYLDDTGIENISCAIVDQARQDFIKGGKVLYSILKRIPTQNELLQDPLHCSLTNNNSVRWMYDSWRFVQEDPYSMFDSVGDKAVIDSWKMDSIIAYYKDLYLPGATKLYSYKNKDVEIYDEDDTFVMEHISNFDIVTNFLTSKNYIYSLTNGKEILNEWNKIAYERSTHKKKGEKSAIYKSEYIDGRKKNKIENSKRAKELFLNGLSIKAIAKYLGVKEQTVRLYLKNSSS